MPGNQALIVTMTKYSSKKTTRDPNAPKRNLSAYLLYQNYMRSFFKSQNPEMSFGDLAKYTSSKYSELTQEEKLYWQNKAQEDKDRYVRELSMYQPPMGFDAKGDNIEGPDKKSGKKRAAKAQRDKKAPKRNLSAYLLYQNGMRAQFKQEYPQMSFGELSKHTSQQYNALTKEEKAVWIEKAEEDKKRYDRELCDYVPPTGYDAYGVQILGDADSNRKRSGKRGGKAEVVQFAVPGNIVMSNYGMIYPHHMDIAHTAL